MKIKSLIFLFLIFILSFIINADLFNRGLPLTHDGQDHIARIANFYKNLEDSNIVPRWAPDLNWGYGHPILMFLYPLPSYIASFFHFVGFSFVDSAKIVFGLSVVLSGISMYMWLSSFLPEEAGFTAAILYMFTPYRFVENYVRGDIGESLSFVFPPLIFYFLFKLSKKINWKYFLFTGFSVDLLVLSHNAVSLMFIPLVILYGLFLLLQLKNKKSFLISFVCSIILGLSLSAFFWIPGLFEGKYTLRNIVTAGEYVSRFVPISKILYSPWSYGITGQFSVQIGIINLLGLVLTPLIVYLFYKKRNKLNLLTLILCFYTGICIFLMLKESNFIWEKLTILQNFQFPWRFLLPTVFTTSAIIALLITVIPKKIKLVFSVTIVLLILFLNKNYWHASGCLIKPESFFTTIYYGTTDTGESAPIWSVRFMEKPAKSDLEVIDGKAITSEILRSSTIHEYLIRAEKNSYIKENTLYFPGWEVLVDGKPTSVEFQNPQSRGILTFSVSRGLHDITVVFKETKLRLVSDIISLVSILFIVVYSGFIFIKKRYL
ncbi:MAG: glycosyltransferase family 39 protein [Cyanobacteria bacterium]|nr:glycosyltransferase family 39 protein [Cyanobacteriota bacterium]